jgi:predicted NACHT family NTPase
MTLTFRTFAKMSHIAYFCYSEPQTEPSCLFELIKHEYQRNSRIERIMNPSKSFPIEQSYINLAIVETKEQQEKEKKLLHATLTNEIIGTYEEIYGTKTRIEIENIFERCTEQTKNILVLGRAGIGKTTFCRYVAYQWATGAFWQQYQLVIFIRLRNLTEGRYPPLTSGTRYSLVDLIKTEYCCYNLSEKDEKLLKEQLDKSEVLWLLDGYDEITQNVPSYLGYLFEQLLKTPHHIITSRPYLNTLSYNVQLEITGFTDDNIEEYVEQFFDQIKDEIDNGSLQVQKLLNFLKYSQKISVEKSIILSMFRVNKVFNNQF